MIRISDSSSMNLFASSTLVLSYWIIAFIHLHFVSGEKPHCTGEPLNPEEFSKKGDVGFVRDICVDVISRNLNNRLGLEASNLCEELANMRTSTCFTKIICLKWKRWYSWNISAMKRIMIKAEELIEELNDSILKNACLDDFDDENFICGRVADAEDRLLTSRAVLSDSNLIKKLESLKRQYCIRYQLAQNQKRYLIFIGDTDPEVLKRVDEFAKNNDLGAGLKLFFEKFEAENLVKITNFYIMNPISKIWKEIISGIPTLYFEYIKDGLVKFGRVTMQIISIYSRENDALSKNLFNREAHFYGSLLPKLYALGKCEQFAPFLYAIIDSKAYIIEDLFVRGYKPGSKLNQLDLEESLESLVLLAKYHALGYKYLQTLGNDDPGMSLIRSDLSVLTEKSKKQKFDEFCELLQPFLTKELYQKILNVEDKILAEPWPTKYPEENSITVIIHGNYQPSNILFKKDDKSNKIIQVKMTDWHSSRKAHPIMDLIFFFVASIPLNVFEANYNTLVDSYVTKLNHVLSQVKSTRFYYEPELSQDILNYKYYCLRIILIDWPIIMQAGPPSENTDTYVKNALEWVNYFERKGIL